METVCDNVSVVSLVICVPSFSTDAVQMKSLTRFNVRMLNVLIF